MPSINHDKLITIENMFADCKNLTNVEFVGDFRTTNIDNMAALFYNCINLISINFPSNFSIIGKYFQNIFKGCSSLEYINFNIFKTRGVINMACLFENTKLTSYDLNNFDTSKLIDAQSMFYNCTEVISLNLSNFDFSNVAIMDYMFANCINLTYVNFGTTEMKENASTFHIFNNCSKKMIIYVNKSNTEKFFDDSNFSFAVVECGDIPSQEIMKMYPENKIICVKSCKVLKNYKFKYLNRCYVTCPSDTIMDEINLTCENIKFQINNEKYSHIISTNLNFICDINDFFSEKCKYNYQITETNKSSNISNTDIILEKIRLLINYGFDTNFLDNGNDYVLASTDAIYTITTPLNQRNNKKNNQTNIDLDKCEEKLIEKYNITQNNSLYILKIDFLIDNILKIEYEIYNKNDNNNFTKLNLSICEDIKIKTFIPKEIPLNQIDLYNKSSKLYNDICYTLTTETGTDISIKDRQNEYKKNNISVCEEDCDFIEYDAENSKAICFCYIKKELPLLSKIKVNKEKMFSNFKNIKNIANFKLLNCIHLLLNKNNIFINTANYMAIILFLLSIIALFSFINYNYIQFKNNIKQIWKLKNMKYENQTKK